MSSRDVFESINEQDDATVQRLIDRLEYRDRDSTFVRYRNAYLDRIAFGGVGAVLDLGCGTGVVTRELARRSESSCTIVAVDHSPALIRAARQLAAEGGIGGRIAFEVGDAHRLPYPDGDFDVVIAHTLVSHVTDPREVLLEAARVVRPGGTVAIFDGDYASWGFGSSDPSLGKMMEEGLITAVVAQPRIMRDMSRLLPDSGLQLADLLAFVYADAGAGGFFLASAETFGPMVARAGLVPSDRVDAWLVDQRLAASRGAFFASCNYYAWLARR